RWRTCTTATTGRSARREPARVRGVGGARRAGAAARSRRAGTAAGSAAGDRSRDRRAPRRERRAERPRPRAGGGDPGPVRRAAAGGRPRHHHEADPGILGTCRAGPHARSRQRRRARLRLLGRAGPSHDVTEFAFQAIPQLGRLLRDRKATAVELAEYFLDRLERLGPNYNAVVTVLREPALAEARERDAELRRGKE